LRYLKRGGQTMKQDEIQMKMRFVSSIIVLGAALFFYNDAFSQKNEIELLLDYIKERQDSYPEYSRLKASAVTTTTKMDKNWKPKKVTVVKKILKFINGKEIEEILQVLETEKGITKDITEEYVKEAGGKKVKGAKKRERNEGGTFELTKGEIFPFEEEKRKNYDFIKLEDFYIDGFLVYVLETRARVKEEKTWEGTYYIDKDQFDVLKVKIKPSRNPKFIKEFDVDMDFRVTPEGYYVLKSSKVKINGGIFIKRIRMIVEEERSDYEVMDKEERGF